MDYRHMCFSAKYRGQSLSETAISISVIAIVAIGSLTLLGNTMGSQLPDLFSLMYGNEPSGGPTGETPPIPGPDPLMDGFTPMTITLENGQTLTLQYPTTYLSDIETSGANGITEDMLASLDSLIDGLRQTDSLTEAQYNALRNLSNKGHEIAAIEKLLETHGQSLDDRAQFLSTSIMTGDGPVDAATLAASIGWQSDLSEMYSRLGIESNPTGILDAANTTPCGQVMCDFLQLFRDAQASGALNDPAVNALVRNLSTQITITSEGMDHSVAIFQTWHEPNAEEYTSYGDNPYQELLALTQWAGTSLAPPSAVSDLSAAGICNAGGGGDNGITCQ